MKLTAKQATNIGVFWYLMAVVCWVLLCITVYSWNEWHNTSYLIETAIYFSTSFYCLRQFYKMCELRLDIITQQQQLK